MDSLRSTAKEGTAFELIASADDDFACGYKDCKVCGETKPLKEYRVEAKGVQGRKAVCKVCTPSSTPKIKVDNDRIQRALEAAAYRIIKESM